MPIDAENDESALHAPVLEGMADLCLKLGEGVESGEEVPQWVGITHP